MIHAKVYLLLVHPDYPEVKAPEVGVAEDICYRSELLFVSTSYNLKVL